MDTKKIRRIIYNEPIIISNKVDRMVPREYHSGRECSIEEDVVNERRVIFITVKYDGCTSITKEIYDNIVLIER